MIPRLGRHDEAHLVVTAGADQGGVGGQAVAGGDDLHLRVISAKAGDQSLGGVAFTVVLLGPVAVANRFGHQGNDFGMVRMRQDGCQELVVVRDAAVAVVFDQAVGAVDRLGAEVFGAVKGQQVVPLVKDE